MSAFSKAEGIPLYVKIRETLREDIKRGEHKQGEKLPSEDELAAKYGVSRMTVRQGIMDLIDEGLVYRRHGVGTFVAFPHVERDHSRLTNFFEIAKKEGVSVSAQILTMEVTPAKHKIANELGIDEGDTVIHIKTLRFSDDVPVTVHDAFIPHKLFASILTQDLKTLENQHLWSILESYGYRLKRAVQRLEAREAGEEIAELLNIETNAPILYKERTAYADDGTPVEFIFCYNRGDMYSLTVTLER
ncbi:MAG: GntR family transcriptional regulator [Anaerolineales bacterium]|nr:GntR family transcriptional regulator [Anaerolineales bacterium]